MMRKLLLLASLAFSALPGCPVSANVLTPADAKVFSEAALQAATIGTELFPAQQPSSRTLSCALNLSTPLNKFLMALEPVKLLTRLAARMADRKDEQEVLNMLGEETQEFLSKLKEVRNGTQSIKVMPDFDCVGDSRMVVEAEKLLRICDKIEAAVRSIIKKMDAANENTASRADDAASASADDDSAENFRKKCASWAGKDIRSFAVGSDSGFCLGTMMAVLNVGAYLSEDLRFCPESKRPIVGVGVIARYLRAHPDRQSDVYLPVIVEAFHYEWPCK
jgi:hypothetical protein